MQNQLIITGMHCTNCALRIEKSLKAKEGILAVSINFASETALIDFEEEKINLAEIISEIEKIGFGAREVESFNLKENKKIPLKIIVLILLALMFLWSMLFMALGKHSLMLPANFQFILALIAQFFCIPFYKGAWASLKSGVANMDILISLGTTIIFLYSSVEFFKGSKINGLENIYFEGSVMILTFVSLGKYIEQRLKKSTLNSLNELIALTPQKLLKKVGTTWKEVKISEIKVKDILKTQHGEKIGADGVLKEGNIWCDESHLSGESQAIEKNIGDKVLAGALVISGNGVYEAEKLGLETQLGEMMKALDKAQGSKAEIARIADKVASVFVPMVIGISLLTFLITYLFKDFNQAIVNAVSVLVIACPCAMGLATPAAIMAGMGKAIKNGIQFKSAEDLEKTGRITKVIFDKTGTLTLGKPKINQFLKNPQSIYSQEEIFAYCAAVEKNTTHPLAVAVAKFSEANSFAGDVENIKLSEVKTQAGAGISAQIKEIGEIKIGTIAWTGAEIPPNRENEILVGVAINDTWVGVFALSDEIKESSKIAIESLRELKISSLMLTGDRKESAKLVADFLNIDFKSELSPQAKADEIEKLKKSGEIIAMVGDGINDAAALAVCDVGFSLASGSESAKNNSSVHLNESSPKQMVLAIKIAQKTVKKIKENLTLSLIYNCAAIPSAAFGFLSPAIAGLAMALSSISVIVNSTRCK